MAAGQTESRSYTDSQEKLFAMFSVAQHQTNIDDNGHPHASRFKQQLLKALNARNNSTFEQDNLIALKHNICIIEKLLEDAGEVLATLINQQDSEHIGQLHKRNNQLKKIINDFSQENISHEKKAKLITQLKETHKKIKSKFYEDQTSLEILVAEIKTACINTKAKVEKIKAIKRAIIESEKRENVQALGNQLSSSNVDILQAYNTETHKQCGIKSSKIDNGCSIIDFLGQCITTFPDKNKIYSDIFQILLKHEYHKYSGRQLAVTAMNFIRNRLARLTNDGSYRMRLNPDKSTQNLAEDSPIRADVAGGREIKKSRICTIL